MAGDCCNSFAGDCVGCFPAGDCSDTFAGDGVGCATGDLVVTGCRCRTAIVAVVMGNFDSGPMLVCIASLDDCADGVGQVPVADTVIGGLPIICFVDVVGITFTTLRTVILRLGRTLPLIRGRV